MQHTDEEELPRWFRITSKIAKHFLYGVCILYFLLQLNWTNEHLNKTVLAWIDVFLVIIAVPTFIFAGADIIKILVKIISVFKNDA